MVKEAGKKYNKIDVNITFAFCIYLFVCLFVCFEVGSLDSFSCPVLEFDM